MNFPTIAKGVISPIIREPVHETPVQNVDTMSIVKEPDTVPPIPKDSPITKHSNDSTKLATPASLSSDVTIVTAFFDIGKFQKGDGSLYFTPDLYHTWMKVFGKIQNPVVFYFETDRDVTFMRNLRKDLDPSLTKIVLLNRTRMWSFGDVRERISDIFRQPSYPKHHPNTVVPEYSCAMHAKYEVMNRTAYENPFKTKYFAWLDIGLFRELKQSSPFRLTLPPNFDQTKVAYTEVYPRSQRTATQIFHDNLVWVCGCFFIAEGSVMTSWVHEYIKATELFLDHGVMNTDQQIIMSMFVADNFGFRPRTQLQLYKGDGRFNEWFHLGYVCKDEGDRKSRQSMK